MSIESRLKEIIETSELSQAEFAKKLGVSQATLSRWLSGKRQIDNLTALAIQVVFGYDATWLLFGDETKAPDDTIFRLMKAEAGLRDLKECLEMLSKLTGKQISAARSSLVKIIKDVPPF